MTTTFLTEFAIFAVSGGLVLTMVASLYSRETRREKALTDAGVCHYCGKPSDDGPHIQCCADFATW